MYLLPLSTFIKNHNFTSCFYGCETWSLTLREEHRLKYLRRGCCGEYLDLRGRKWREAREDYLKDLHKLYASPSVIRVIKIKQDGMGGAYSTNGRDEKAYNILAEKN
jgi:hypothetical protein